MCSMSSNVDHSETFPEKEGNSKGTKKKRKPTSERVRGWSWQVPRRRERRRGGRHQGERNAACCCPPPKDHFWNEMMHNIGQAEVWCPAVTIPPRVPLYGRLPRGQRRELLWTIGRGSPIFEGRIEVTRAIEDPLVQRQLEHAQDFQRRFAGTTMGDGERVPASGLGQAGQDVHSRPFLLMSRKISPSQNEYTWRGVNKEGTVQVLRSRDGADKTFMRYTETLKVGPRDGGYGVGRYRLALDAGSTDCSFRLLLWNRTATAEDRTITTRPLPTSAPSTPRTLAVPYWKPLPGDEGSHEPKGAGGDEPQTLEVRASPLLASRSNACPKPSNIPNDQDMIRMFMPEAPGDEIKVDSSCKRDGQAVSSEAAAGGCSPRTTDSADANPTTHTPGVAVMRSALPNSVKSNVGSKICSRDQCVQLTNSEHLYVTSGASSPCTHVVAATASAEEETRPASAAAVPASDTRRTAAVEGNTTTTTTTATTRARWGDKIAGGCRRQLAVATHYLNSSVFPPTRPTPVVEPRPATTTFEATTARREFSAVNERGRDRPRTAGPPTNRRPCTRDGSIWHSIPGDGRERAAAQAARLLSASPTVIGRPSNGSFAPVPRRPPGREPIESPRRGEREPVSARGGRRAPPFGLDPADRKAFSPKDGIPACLPRQARPARDIEGGEWGGEVGYTISSQYRGPPERGGFDGDGCAPTVAPLVAPRSESLTPSPPAGGVKEKQRQATVVSRVPKVPIDRVVHDVQSLLPSPCYDQHSKKQQQQQQQQVQQQQCGDICFLSRSRSAPLLRDPPLHTATCSINGEDRRTRPQEDHQVVTMTVDQIARRRPRSQSFDVPTGGICEIPPTEPISSDSRAQRQRPHSARARYYCRSEDAMGHPRRRSSKEEGHDFNRDPHTSNCVAYPSKGGSSIKSKHAGGRGATDEGVNLRDGETGSPASVSSSLAALADRTDGGYRFPDVGKADSSTTLEIRNPTPARGDRGNVTPRGCDVGGKGVAATAKGKKWMMPTRDEVVRWGRDIDRLLKIRATRKEGETMMAVNGREQFMYSSGGETEM